MQGVDVTSGPDVRLVRMPTSSDDADRDPTEGEGQSSGSARALSPAEREKLLAKNRRTRDELRAAEEKKAEQKKAGVAEAGDDDADLDDADLGDADLDDGEPGDVELEEADPSRIPGKVPTARTGSTAGRKLVAGLLALIVALAVAVGVLGYLLATADSGVALDSGTGEQALADAKTYAAEVVTYGPDDYADLDRRIREISTPDFADRYIEASQDARRGTDEAKASSVGTAIAAGAESISDDEAVVLVALNQKVTSPELPTAGEEGLDYQTRVRVTLQRDGDRWILADLVTI